MVWYILVSFNFYYEWHNFFVNLITHKLDKTKGLLILIFIN